MKELVAAESVSLLPPGSFRISQNGKGGPSDIVSTSLAAARSCLLVLSSHRSGSKHIALSERLPLLYQRLVVSLMQWLAHMGTNCEMKCHARIETFSELNMRTDRRMPSLLAENMVTFEKKEKTGE